MGIELSKKEEEVLLNALPIHGELSKCLFKGLDS